MLDGNVALIRFLSHGRAKVNQPEESGQLTTLSITTIVVVVTHERSERGCCNPTTKCYCGDELRRKERKGLTLRIAGHRQRLTGANRPKHVTRQQTALARAMQVRLLDPMRASYQAVAPTLRSRQGRIAGAPGPHGPVKHTEGQIGTAATPPTTSVLRAGLRGLPWPHGRKSCRRG